MSPGTSRFGTVRRLPSGRYQQRYPDGGRREKSARTFAEYAPEQVDSRNLMPRTRVLDERRLALCTLPTLGRYELTNVPPEMVRVWWRGLDPETPTARAHAAIEWGRCVRYRFARH